MRAGVQHRFTEETQLEEKQSELRDLRVRHAAAQEILQQLKDGIEEFRRHCDETLAWRLYELEGLEKEIATITRRKALQHRREESHPVAANIKSLYRKVAKAIHPDLAEGRSSGNDPALAESPANPVRHDLAGAPAKPSRHELMLKANRAYAEDDLGTLREILGTWRRLNGLPEVGELERVNRLILRERRGLETVNAQVAEVRRNCAWRLKLRSDRAAAGEVPVEDMLAIADLTIAAALRRLSVLKGGMPQPAPRQRKGGSRGLRFPEQTAAGMVYVRDAASVSYADWKAVGRARGNYQVETGKAVRLDLEGKDAAGKLQMLQPDDLHSLFLYHAQDRDIENIIHLTGLRELYLSGPGLTDAALAAISSLRKLRRLYIYQTSISDLGLLHLRKLPCLDGVTSSGNAVTEAGLQELRRILPSITTVTFQWRR